MKSDIDPILKNCLFFCCTYPYPGINSGNTTQTSLGLQGATLIQISGLIPGLAMDSISFPSGKQYSKMALSSGTSGGFVTVESFAWHILKRKV